MWSSREEVGRAVAVQDHKRRARERHLRRLASYLKPRRRKRRSLTPLKKVRP